MHAHGTITQADRDKFFGLIQDEIRGELPKSPFHRFGDLDCRDAKTTEIAIQSRLKLAVARDGQWGTANGRYIRVFGLAHALRFVYDGAASLREGGVKE